MATTDLSPLYRTLVGFDRMASLMDQASRLDVTPGYPPFNIEQTGEDGFRIELAVAGFGEDDLSIEYKQNTLTVSGAKAPSEDAHRYLHRGIAERNSSAALASPITSAWPAPSWRTASCRSIWSASFPKR